METLLRMFYVIEIIIFLSYEDAPFTASPVNRIVALLFKGKPAERRGRKTTGLRGIQEDA